MNRTKRFLGSLGLASSTFLLQPAYADSYDLLSLYQAATSYDAGIAAAKAAYQAEQQGEDLALSSLLPTVVAEANTGHTHSDSDPALDDSYRSTSYAVSLTQPLLDMGSWYDYTAAEQNSLLAETDYLSAQQDLILNIASAYFGVLRAKEDVIVAESLQAAVKRQYEQAKEQFDVGLIAITDVHEAKALFDDSNTTRIGAEGALTLAIEQLSRLTGKYISDLYGLKKNFPITIDSTNSSDAWVEAAEQNNLAIKLAEYALEARKAVYESSKSGHYPTLDLNAKYENSDTTGYSTTDPESETRSIFLNLTVPIYTGGATQASSKQNRFLVEQARFQLESAKRQARIDARTQFINLRTNAQTVESLQQNIISRESALEATREGYKVGTRNIVEVLDAERAYFTALRDYASARFDFVESSLRLKRAAGTLSVKDIEELNQWLKDEA